MSTRYEKGQRRRAEESRGEQRRAKASKGGRAREVSRAGRSLHRVTRWPPQALEEGTHIFCLVSTCFALRSNWAWSLSFSSCTKRAFSMLNSSSAWLANPERRSSGLRGGPHGRPALPAVHLGPDFLRLLLCFLVDEGHHLLNLNTHTHTHTTATPHTHTHTPSHTG